jgi:hypothetical protein
MKVAQASRPLDLVLPVPAVPRGFDDGPCRDQPIIAHIVEGVN